MAYERLSDQKNLGSDFDLFLDGTIAMYNRQLAARNADDELRFNQAVLEQNLSLDDQLEYRKGQLKRVSDDPAESKRVMLEISNLKDRIEQKEFADAYLDKLIDLESGITSVDSVINWLNDRSAGTTDMTIKNEIQKQLVSMSEKKFTLVQDMIKNQTAYAIQDKTDNILSEQLKKVTAEKNKALLAGQDALVSVYDLQIQSLNKAKNEAAVEKTIKEFAVKTVSGYMSATQLLDSYNAQVASASGSTPITINDVTYSSAREYWAFKRDSYISDSGESGFFSRFNTEQNTALKVKNSQETLGVGDVAESSGRYDGLRGRTELQGYEFKIDTYKQDTIQTGSNLLATKVLSDYSTGLDINKAFTSLNAIKNLGGNVEDFFTKVMLDAASIVDPQQQAMSQAAFDIIEEKRAAGQPINIDEIMKQVSAQGVGKVFSAEELTTKPAGDIAKERIESYEKETAPTTPDPRLTLGQPTAQEPAPPLAIQSQLDFGMSSAEVKALQQFLNKQGFAVASAGQPGSAGFETEYFGPSTQKAVQQFQAAQGIVSTGDAQTTGYGRVGPQTLTAIQKLYK